MSLLGVCLLSVMFHYWAGSTGTHWIDYRTAFHGVKDVHYADEGFAALERLTDYISLQ